VLYLGTFAGDLPQEEIMDTHFELRYATTIDDLYEVLNAPELDDYRLVGVIQLQDKGFLASLENVGSYVEETDEEVHA
jgi:hypothetical protein